ncbi:MAG: 3-oxoacyl-[acyl-carrier-protein] reductase, partial [Gemmatimonadetes bacterium]|nr:3-oxoacyl-[acyl-carrier-protein] reductase [Gemmatimonadota bacterium]
MRGLKDKVTIVTGGAQGIGSAVAERFAAEGARIVLTSRDGAKAQEAADALNREGGDARGVSLSIDDRDSVKNLVATVVEDYGAIDVLINNAATVRDTLLMRMKQDDWDEVIHVNLGGVFACTQAVIRQMMRQRSGRIINMTSIVGLTGNPGQANYAASKAGIIGFTKSVAKEVGSRGITVNAIAPGYIETAMTEALPEAVRSAFLEATPLSRAGQPDDVAGIAAFLASDDAAFV